MKYRPNRMGEFLHGSDARRVTTMAAGRILARARALAPVDGRATQSPGYTPYAGYTRDSGRLEHGVSEDGSRVQVSVSFGGAAVSEQFSRHGSKFLTRALRDVADG